jgi:leucyl-tRNA synthetase
VEEAFAYFDGDALVDKNADTGELKLKSDGQVVVARYAIEKDVVMREGAPVHREFDVKVVPVAEKMSKSRGNVINPDTVVEEFGADSLRLYEMFMGPLEAAKPWQTSGIQGVRRFLDRVDAVCSKPLSEEPADLPTKRIVARSIKKVGEDIDGLRFNTAISTMMIWANHLASYDAPPREAVEALVLCVSPFAPHLAEELWERLGHAPSIARAPWPTFDPALCEDDTVEMGVQVNGKVRGRITLKKDADAESAVATALEEPNVRKFIGEKSVKKTIYVAGKILNLILG